MVPPIPRSARLTVVANTIPIGRSYKTSRAPSPTRTAWSPIRSSNNGRPINQPIVGIDGSFYSAAGHILRP